MPWYKGMELLKDFRIKDIIISDDFSRTVPADRKVNKARSAIEQGVDTAAIVINNDNVLIDGYCTYLAAIELGIENITVTRGYVEMIEAMHSSSSKVFKWRVPPYLIGRIKPGDRCIVITSKGVRRVRVKNIIQQQYIDSTRTVRKVIKKCN